MGHLPQRFRPRTSRYRKLETGLDFPAFFIDGLKSIDPTFHLVWHPYRVIWDNIINEYSGGLEEPRYTINEDYNELTFGFVLTDGKSNPIPENKWHVWKLNDPFGWSHIAPVESTHGAYLNLLLKTLYLKHCFIQNYGFKNLSRIAEALDQEKREKMLKDNDEIFKSWQDENSWLVKKAMDNFEYGRTAPTNPTKDTIISAPGVKHRSRIITPLGDEAGGIYTGE